MALLDVKNLTVNFKTNDGDVTAVDNLSFGLEQSSSLAIVGESGSGKSQTAFAMMGLLARNGQASGSVKFNGQEILNIPLKEINKVRGSEISIVFQDPMTSLNPYMRVTDQMAEVLLHHKGMSKRDAATEVVRMLDAVKIPDAKARATLFPHEFSGGMRQRVMIAMSLLTRPKLLIADEPTTALDVTVQAQIMTLFGDLQREFGMAAILITHDLGVVAGFAQDVLVLYGGQVMEHASTEDIFAAPLHPYTRGLLSAIPRIDGVDEELRTIRGSPPNMLHPPAGCPFAPRCSVVGERCHRERPELTEMGPDRQISCWKALEDVE